MEAGASGTPVVVSENTPISELVKQGDFGFSVEYGSIAELTETMSRILDNDELAKRIGGRGRKFVFENYDWKNIIPKFEALYQSVVRPKE